MIFFFFFCVLVESVVRVDECQEHVNAWKKNLTGLEMWTKSSFFDCVWENQQISDFLQLLTQAASNRLVSFPLSQTFEGREIRGYRFSLDLKRNVNPIIYVQGMLHAREWLSPMAIIFTIARFVDATSMNKKNRTRLQLFKHADFVFVPMINQDGYIYSYNQYRMWRKNRRPHRYGFFGTDLNRNYGPKSTFCQAGASRNKSSEVYCGEYPFSEPEISGIERWMKTQSRIIGSIDVHTFGASVLVPLNASQHYPLALKMVQSMNSIQSEYIFRVYNTSTGGTFKDSQFLQYQARPSFTLELRGVDFDIEAPDIRSSGEETTVALLSFAMDLLRL